jgi:hypothetical protein
MALINIGSGQISALTENNKSARTISQLWGLIRDFVLAAHPWKFAAKITELSQLTATPTNRWDYAYQLPIDFLKDQRIGEPESNLPYDIVGNQLHTDQEEAVLTYTYRVENVGLWPAHFCITFAYRIAQDMAIPLLGAATGSKIKNDMRNEYLLALRDAESHNDSQGYDRDVPEPTRWTEARK